MLIVDVIEEKGCIPFRVEKAKCIACDLCISGRLPHIGHFSVTAQRSIRKLANWLCKPIDIRLVFTTFKVRNLFNVKDAVLEGLRTRVVYKFSCASCNACYVGETSRHFST